MTSNRPYLLRAMYEWISDNGLTPYILVDANAPGVRVPKSAIKDGRAVLNVAARAVAQLELGAGVSQAVEAPMSAVLAIYAQENGQGMMFPAENQPPTQPPESTDSAASAPAEPAPKKGPHLRVVK